MRRNRKRLLRRRLLSIALGGLALLALISVLSVLSLRWVPPVTTAFMLSEWSTAGLEHRPDYHWVRQDQIAPALALAAVAAEDQRFPGHRGFDFVAIKGAALANLRGESSRGASTISQQLAKNLFLWRGRSWLRKGLEVWFTAWIELLLPKQRILELYLNVAQFGRGVYGVEAASNSYFNTGAERLSLPQAALLMTVLPSPTRWQLDRPSPYLKTRQHWVMQQMEQLGSAYLVPIGWARLP